MIADGISFGTRLFTGGRARWIGPVEDDNRPRVYFANHTSNLDFVLLWSVLPAARRRRTRPAAAHDYWTAGRLRRWLAARVFRAVLIERRHVTRANNPLEQLGAVLEAGESIIIFPEGGRSTGPQLGPFKSGIFHLAKRHPEAELIPVYIDNLNRVLPKGEFLPLPLLCSVTFGVPLVIGADETKEAFLERARQAVETMGVR